MSPTKTLSSAVESEFEIKKSRFIGRIEPIASHEEGLDRVAQLWVKHPDARHICYSMLVNGQVRQSDDGEPSGTAARPMLNVLQHKCLDNVLATVVRYFGGIKLGAGGLVRAYSQAISDPLNHATLEQIRPQTTMQLSVAYEFESLVRHQAQHLNLSLEVQYQQQVYFNLSGEKETLMVCLNTLSNQLRGQLTLHNRD